jgi:3'(2'), 5'-bisphosphate nucleotidase
VAIRSVQASREGKEGVGLKVELKDKNDPRSALTEADFASQLEVIGSLRRTWKEESDLRIVGEEDDSDIEDAIMKFINDETKSLLPTDLFDDDIGETADIDASTITVFVDPLDGTREFVENRLANCQVLVGVSIGGEAVAGAIGIPFPAGDLSVESTIVYGIADMGAGIRGSPLTRGPFPLDHHVSTVIDSFK